MAPIRAVEIRLPPHLDDLSLDSFLSYLKWQQAKQDLKAVKEAFQEGIAGESRYCYPWQEIPAEEDFELGPFHIKLKTAKKPGTVSWEKVISGFKASLEYWKSEWERGRLKDFRTLDGELYLPIDRLEEKLGELSEKYRGEEGLKRELKLEKPEIQVPEVFVYLLDQDYSKPTGTNARYWAEARQMLEEGEKRTVGYKEDGKQIKRFKEILYEESLSQLGSEPESPARVPYAFDGIVFIHQLEPRKRKQYSKIYQALVKERPKKLTENSRIGDFEKIKLMILAGAEGELRELGLVDDEFMQDYQPHVRNGRIYVRLNGLIKRIGEYENRFSTRYIEQNLWIAEILPGSLRSG